MPKRRNIPIATRQRFRTWRIRKGAARQRRHSATRSSGQHRHRLHPISARVLSGTPPSMVDLTEDPGFTSGPFLNSALPTTADSPTEQLHLSPERSDKSLHPEGDGARQPDQLVRRNQTNDEQLPGKEISILRQAGRLLGGRPLLIVCLVLVSVAVGLCESLVLALVAQIAAALVDHRTIVSIHLGPLHVREAIGILLGVAIGVSIVRLGLQVVMSYLPARVSADIQARMRDALFAAYTRASWSVQSADGEGKFQDLMTSQIVQATQAVVQATQIVTSGMMLVVLVGSALIVGLVPALVVIGAASLLFVSLRPMNRLGRRHARALSAAQLEYAAGVHDAVNVTEEAHVFGIRDEQESEIHRLIDNSRRRFFTTQFLGRLVPGIYQSAILLFLLAGLAALAAFSAGHLATLGAVVLLLLRASSYGQQTQGAYHLLHQSLPFVERIDDDVAKYEASPVIRGHRRLDAVPSIKFRDVSYAYIPGVTVLDRVNFAIQSGESVGVVGPTGAGKSTLVQILLGLRDPQGGEYLVADESSGRWSLPTWTRAFAYVPQDPRLLHGTVADNIRFYRELDDDAVERAAREAHIHDEIMSWSEGYDTEISQRAKAVSGGQRQRLCLARALAGNPMVLVLDEPTSQLDLRSESLVQQSLYALKGRVTLIIVAHRFSTLNLCDRVMVMRDGRLEAFGSADELVRTNDFYRKAATLSRSAINALA